MKNVNKINVLLLCWGVISCSTPAHEEDVDLSNPNPTTICNPMNLSYRYCLDAPSRREAADPTMVVYKGEYYLFASKSGGYFH